MGLSGINLSISKAIKAPEIKKNKERNTPCKLPWYLRKVSSAEANKSVKDTVIITPAEKDKAKVSSFLFCFLEKNNINAPIIVDNPANRDKINGIKD